MASRNGDDDDDDDVCGDWLIAPAARPWVRPYFPNRYEAAVYPTTTAAVCMTIALLDNTEEEKYRFCRRRRWRWGWRRVQADGERAASSLQPHATKNVVPNRPPSFDTDKN